MILGKDCAALLDDGTPVVIYPLMGSGDWKADETIDPNRHIFSELVPGTTPDYVAVHRWFESALEASLLLLNFCRSFMLAAEQV